MFIAATEKVNMLLLPVVHARINVLFVQLGERLAGMTEFVYSIVIDGTPFPILFLFATA